jgi:Type IX secretion system membrane protein PorP/SprF
MKNASPNLLLLMLLLSSTFFALAQEPFNTETRFSNMSRNPAFTGIQVADLKIGLCYHHQLKTVLLPYRSLQVQIESRFRRKDSEDGFTAGALMRYDEAGNNQLKRAQFLPVINFHKSLSEVKVSYLSFGFMTGIFKTQFDPLSLPTIQNYHPIPFNPTNPVPQKVLASSSSYFDFSTGVSWHSELNHQVSMNWGAALFHFSQNVLKQEVSIPKIPREWVLNNSILITEKWYSIQLLTDIRINKFETKIVTAFIFGTPIYQNLLNQSTEIQLGAYYNSNKELSPVFSINCPNYIISVCYNILTGTSHKMPVLENAFETNLVFNINCHKKNNDTEKMRCFN